jgi:hypothetical protein
MSGQVNRYDLIISSAGNHMEKRKDGDWVEFDDYERLETINAELVEALENIAKKVETLQNEEVSVKVALALSAIYDAAITKAKGKQ